MRRTIKLTNKNVCLFLVIIAALSVFCIFAFNVWLKPYALTYTETGEMTAGYFLYAAIGLLLSTPAPFISVLLIALFKERIGLKEFLKGIF